MPQQSHPPVPPASSAPAAAPDAHYHMPATNPGQTTGIIGLILPFVGLSLVGLVISIVSTVQSAKANASRALGIIGIVMNAITIIITLFLLFVILTLTSHANLQDRVIDAQTRTSAAMVRSQAETYNAQEGRYPASVRDIAAAMDNSLPNNTQLVDGTPLKTKEVGYRQCGATGATIQYLVSSNTTPTVLYLGTGSAESCR